MLFAIIANDKNDALDVRMAVRPDHLAFLADLGEKLVFAGPFLDEDAQANGSLVVLEADNMKAAEKIAAMDPYEHAGLFASVSIRPWKWVLNNKEGR